MLMLFLAALEDPEKKNDFLYLYYKYQKGIDNFLLHYLNNTEDAEEAAQDTWFDISRNISKIDLGDKVKERNYIYKVAKSKCVNVLRERKRNSDIIFSDFTENLQSSIDIENVLHGQEEYKKIIEIILSMPDIYQTVLSLHYVNELKAKEIAKMLNLKYSTVKSRLSKGNELLKNLFKEVGIYDEK